MATLPPLLRFFERIETFKSEFVKSVLNEPEEARLLAKNVREVLQSTWVFGNLVSEGPLTRRVTRWRSCAGARSVVWSTGAAQTSRSFE